jgi:hypothetical protein
MPYGVRMAVAALIISIASAMASLGLVVVTYRVHQEQGSLLCCEFKVANTLAKEEFAEKLRDDPSSWGEQHAAVFAINKGRSAVTIAEWGFAVLDKRGKPTEQRIVSVTRPEDSTALPYRLDGESQQSWMMPVQDLTAETGRYKEDNFDGIVAFVRSGADRMVYAEKPVEFSEHRE